VSCGGRGRWQKGASTDLLLVLFLGLVHSIRVLLLHSRVCVYTRSSSIAPLCLSEPLDIQ
jgi:hypothetical protein